MPDVIANYGNITARGKSLQDRKLFEMSFGVAPTSQRIRQHAPKLAAMLDPLWAHQRSPYSCAEAHALAELFDKVGNIAAMRFQDIQFRIATSDDGYVLWTPCDNCSTWLDGGSGFGSERVYRLNEKALAALA